ncbi:C40 family peptidase [Alteribacter natronophilus]|uniref:C40 family peptidase n=1 Tax=Alteribacter natronophilus TaxID=2583810 RepID=UPI00110D7CAB|nr:peptidoglycan-binding protein [Alteribacter natronophilus]TMW72197.1 peptidase [Alteribacter natronophilus]
MKKVVVSAAIAGGVLLAPQVADAALGDQTLREGMRHGDVQELQDWLKDEGHFSQSTTSTGYFGTITRQAVRDFQRSEGLTVDGIAGPQTFGAMGVSGGNSGSSATTSGSSSANSGSGNWISFNGTLRSGSRGSSVSSLQDALNSLGYDAGNQGIFGPKTASAVRSFQRSAGIGVDGIAGPQTYRALNGESVVKSSSSGSSNNSGTSNASSGSSSSSVDSLISTARSVEGSPYVWGGTSPSGFDCSGFINYVFSQNGKSLPRTVAQLWNQRTPVSSPSRGDLVFFETRTGPSHAGIYLGNGQFIHSGSSTGVTVSSMSNSYWGPRYLGAGRF